MTHLGCRPRILVDRNFNDVGYLGVSTDSDYFHDVQSIDSRKVVQQNQAMAQEYEDRNKLLNKKLTKSTRSQHINSSGSLI